MSTLSEVAFSWWRIICVVAPLLVAIGCVMDDVEEVQLKRVGVERWVDVHEWCAFVWKTYEWGFSKQSRGNNTNYVIITVFRVVLSFLVCCIGMLTLGYLSIIQDGIILVQVCLSGYNIVRLNIRSGQQDGFPFHFFLVKLYSLNLVSFARVLIRFSGIAISEINEDTLNGTDNCQDFYDALMFQERGSKVYCNVCQFFVRAEGHEQRCKVQKHSVVVKEMNSEIRRLAWLGDVLHMLDVYFALIVRCKTVSEITEEFKVHIHRKVQANGLDGIDSNRGKRDMHYEAQKFEANYMSNEFRASYLVRTFDIHSVRSVDDFRVQFRDMYDKFIDRDIVVKEHRAVMVFVGRLLFTYDVREVILANVRDDKMLQVWFSKFTSDVAVSAYARKHKSSCVFLSGYSDNSWARSFMASWEGTFRRAYLCKIGSILRNSN